MKPRISSDAIDTLYSLKDQGETERQRFESLWKDCAKFYNPIMSDWSDDPSAGEAVPSMAEVYDNTGILASQRAADGVQAYGFSRTTTWLRMALENAALMKDDDVKMWMEAMERHEYSQLSKSTFYDAHRSMVQVGLDFGTGLIFRDHDVGRGIPHYTSLHPKRCVIMENEVGEVDVLFRDLWLTSFEAVAQWSKDVLPDAIQRAYEEGKTKKYKFTQFVFPRDRFDLDIESQWTKGMPFYSLYTAELDKTPIEEGGYETKPFWVWRYSSTMNGSPWSNGCPGLWELSNVRQLNGMRADRFRISQVIGQGRWKATEGLRGRLKLNPNGVTYMRAGEDFAPVVHGGNLQPLTEDISAMQNSINESYHTNLFLLLSRNIEMKKTATEVEGLKGEQAAMLTAFYGRLTTESLEPAVEDSVQLEMDTGRAPRPPEILQGMDIKVDLVSPLAQLQKRYLELESTKSAINEILAFAMAKAEADKVQSPAMDRIDEDAYIDMVADRHHMDRTVLRDMADVQKIRQARAQRNQQMMQAEMAEKQAKTKATMYDSASKAPEEGSPMAAMAGGTP